MKIAIITNYWKNSGGGIETFLVNLVDAMQKKGVHINVLFRFGDDPEQFHGGVNKFKFPLACYRQLRRVRPEVIHTHGPWYCLLSGVLYKKFHGCVLVHTVHGEPEDKIPLLTKVILQSLMNVCDCVTFVSKSMLRRYVEYEGFSFQRTAITYAGVRTIEVSDDEVEQFREEYGIREDAIILLTQAMTSNRLKAEGLKLLIKAVQKLHETYPKILLIVTREGVYSDSVKAFVREVGVKNNVIFTGNVKNPYVPLKICDLFTHITKTDGVPLALLEAMSMGKPIIASSIGGIPEAIKDGVNGVLVEPDSEQIADKIKFLLRNREYAKTLGDRAKRTVEEEFTWERSAEQFLALYGVSPNA
jgi:L-malate glycosyltransferase